jgi:hypothetical protein
LHKLQLKLWRRLEKIDSQEDIAEMRGEIAVAKMDSQEDVAEMRGRLDVAKMKQDRARTN